MEDDTPRRARLLVLEGSELVRRGIRDVLESDCGIAVVGEIARPQELADACLKLVPDIVLLALGRCEGSRTGGPVGLEVLQETLRLDPRILTILLLDDATVSDLLEAVRSGVGFLFEHLATSADRPTADLPALRQPPTTLGQLSLREQEVLLAVARGCCNKEIATQLGITVGTVKTYLHQIFRKLDVSDRTQAVISALELRVPQAPKATPLWRRVG